MLTRVFSLYTVALINILLGVMVLIRAKMTRDKIYFVLFVFSVAFWAAAISTFTITTNDIFGLFWAKMIFMAGACIPFLMLMFSYHFPWSQKEITLGKTFLLAIPGIVLLYFIFFTSVLISHINVHLVAIHQRIFFGPGQYFYSLYYFIYILAALRVLRKKYLISKGLERLQIAYAIQAFFIGLALAGVSNILLPLFEVYNFVLSGPYVTLIFGLLITYAILKHRLMNIELVIKRSLIYAVLLGGIIAFYLSIVFIVDIYLQTGLLQSNTYLVVLTTTVIITALYFPRLELWLQRVTDGFFYKGKYNYRITLKDIGKIIAGIISLDELLPQIASIITSTVRIDKAVFYIFNNETKKYECFSDKKNIQCDFLDEKLIQYVEKFKKSIVLHELVRRANVQQELKTICTIMEKLNARMCVPLISRNILWGFLFLGEKLSGDVYSAEDIDLFDSLSSQIGTAIDNAYLHLTALEGQKQIERAKRMASLGTMTAGIAHEIKNPMVALKTFTELLPKKFDDEAYRAKYMEIVPREINRINDLLEGLLKLSRTIQPKFRSVQVKNIIHEVRDLLKVNMRRQNIVYEEDIAPDLAISAERAQIVQVLLNLFLNAIQFMPEGGLLKIRGYCTMNDVCIDVQDTGIGIPEENISRLFDPFFTTRHEGTGLGLAITQKIVEDHHGTIEVQSQVGTGTIFSLRFPRV